MLCQDTSKKEISQVQLSQIYLLLFPERRKYPQQDFPGNFDFQVNVPFFRPLQFPSSKFASQITIYKVQSGPLEIW